ncbi:MAG: hypothetical protein KGL39_44815 [Patescibacteria group bacterium]|nr:hypothetical protein [Patescibacteria group bacterium]
MGFLSALGAFAAARRQKQQDELARQQMTLENQQIQAAIQQQAWDRAFRERQQRDVESSSGIDPTTGRLVPLPAYPGSQPTTEPATQGRGKPTKPSGSPLHDQYTKLMAEALYYAQQPQPAAQAYAKVLLDEANSVGTQIRNYETQSGEMRRTRYVQGEEDTRSSRRQSFDAWLHGQPTYSDLHPRARSTVNVFQTGGNIDYQVNAFNAIDKAKDPRAVAAALAKRAPDRVTQRAILEEGERVHNAQSAAQRNPLVQLLAPPSSQP